MKTTIKKTRPQPFVHAEDLGPAYRELAAAIAAVHDLEQNGPVPFDAKDAARVPELSETSIWLNADEKVAAWQRVGAAARRVYHAKRGPRAPGPARAMRSAGGVHA